MRTESLDEAFRKGLDLPEDVDLSTLRFECHPHWDSLGHMSLVVAIEEEFDIELDDDEVMELESYAAARDLIVKKGASNP